jgi:DNA-binding NarL/FixJ family response regulator
MARTQPHNKVSFPERETMHDTISIFLVAGNRLLREALGKIISKQADFRVCGVSPCLQSATASIVSSATQVLILDSISMQPPDCALLAGVSREVLCAKVLLIDMSDDPEIFLKCVRAGALGYLLKDASSADVVAAVRAVAQAQAVCPPQLCKLLFQIVSQQWAARPIVRMKVEFNLTRRQRQLVPLISQGLTNKEIASQLNLSEQTVKNHIHRIFRRVGAKDRLQVVDLTRHLDTSVNSPDSGFLRLGSQILV